jgi:hypothetical protein
MWLLLLGMIIHAKEVLYFGGYRSSESQMQEMQRLARLEKISMHTITYPSRDSSYEAAVIDGAAIIRHWVGQINRNPDVEIQIVGHSSGAALAIEVARQVVPHDRMRLVILDGFLPSRTFQQNNQVECWAAMDSTNPNLKSYNYSSTRACLRFHVLEYEGCTTSMCLHFALVNKNSFLNGITNANYGRTGYENLRLQDKWLKLTRR